MMRTFNKIFCSDRITIERSFGMTASKWKALLTAIPLKTLPNIILFLNVCFKLHNLCVDEFLCIKYKYPNNYIAGRSYPEPILPVNFGEFNSKHSNSRHVEYTEFTLCNEFNFTQTDLESMKRQVIKKFIEKEESSEVLKYIYNYLLF
jgi:hypothetical protein